MHINSKIFVTESDDFIGAAIVRRLRDSGFTNIIEDKNLDLTRSETSELFFAKHKPDATFLAVGPSAGIQGNINRPAELIQQNLAKGLNTITSAYRAGTKNLIYIASSCVYPRDVPQPMKETQLLTAPFEPTNESYAIAKMATLKLCESFNKQYKTNYISIIPANPFGPLDSFDPENAHVITALIAKMHAKKNNAKLPIWGSGRAVRDFIYVDDLADAAIFLLHNAPQSKTINVSTGHSTTIAELAKLIQEVVGYCGELQFDTSRPEGMPTKTIDGSRIKDLGWTPRILLREGIERTYRWYLSTI